MSSEVHQAHEAAEQMTPTAYISEHLQNLTSTGEHQSSIVDFSVINLDTIFWASLMGFIAVFILLIAARRATPGVPGRFQSLIEMIVEMVANDLEKAKQHALLEKHGYAVVCSREY